MIVMPDLNGVKAWLKSVILKAALWGLAACVFVGVFLFLAIYLYTAPPPDPETLYQTPRKASYTVVDSQNRLLAIRGDFHGAPREIQDLPRHLVQAFLAIEDQRFYHHSGIDFWSLGRAFLANLHAGRTVQGGSTITQQVAKNIFLTPERTMARKLSELIHGIWLERHLTKNEILELYLNKIYLGAGTYGVDAAARFYFGKPATHVNLAQAAMLAGLPKAPSRFAPTIDLERSRQRASLVLHNMRRFGFISRDQEETARANPASTIVRQGTAGLDYFIDAAIVEAEKLIGRSHVDVVVETTIDVRLQRIAEQAVASVLAEKGEESQASEAALVAFNSGGGVVAMVGGLDYESSQFNRATQALRQPGSAFKPFVYLAAIESGIRPDDPVIDEPVRVGNWVPDNYGGSYRGRMSVRRALALSVNSVAVTLSETVGREKVVEAAKRMGITQDLKPYRSIALGTPELTLYELTGAYLPFARQGLKPAPHLVAGITARDGTPLYVRPETNPPRVLAPMAAEYMTHMLYQVVDSGTGTRARLDGHPAAGKTGTSQNFRDAWFVGYTGRRLTGVWVGNDDSSPMNNVTGATLPAEIWHRFMAAAHAGEPAAPMPGAYTAGPDRFGQDELRGLFRRLRRDLDRVRDDRRDIFARTDDQGDPRYEWPPKDKPRNRPYQDRSSRRGDRRKPKWWPF